MWAVHFLLYCKLVSLSLLLLWVVVYCGGVFFALQLMPLEVKRQVWSRHPSAFLPELEGMVTSFLNDFMETGKSLNVFTKHNTHQELLKHPQLHVLYDMIGANVALYNATTTYLLDRFVRTGHPRLATLRHHLLQLHKLNQQHGPTREVGPFPCSVLEVSTQTTECTRHRCMGAIHRLCCPGGWRGQVLSTC